MRLAIELAVVGTSLLLGNMAAAAADPPPEFTGVWILAASQVNECKRTDWKGVAASSTDRLINVTPRVVEMWESGCTIISVKPIKSLFEGREDC